MPILHSSQLDEYVAAVDAHGGDFAHPEIVARYHPLEFAFDTVVDQTLSPFSDEYFAQQIALYREISGRDLDQQAGELHEVDLPALLAAPNPTGVTDVHHVGEHLRVVSTMFALANLAGRPQVMDLGAGHGLSSELFAFAGARVHAVDIDPMLGEVSRRRAAARGYDLRRSDLNFDDVGTLEDGKYDAAFFYQSFHHCLRPWRLIEDISRKLRTDGVVGFAGEPIQTTWWRNWGVRLDDISLYVARKFGWFESGWSHSFISECFARSGMTLTFFGGGHSGLDIGIATADPVRHMAILAHAAELGFIAHDPQFGINDTRFLSHIGVRTTIAGRPAFRQIEGQSGPLLYGPYATLPAGMYEFSLLLRRESGGGPNRDSRLNLDVAAEMGGRVLHAERLDPRRLAETELITRRFELAEPVEDLEIRLLVRGGDRWSASFPVIRPIPQQSRRGIARWLSR